MRYGKIERFSVYDMEYMEQEIRKLKKTLERSHIFWNIKNYLDSFTLNDYISEEFAPQMLTDIAKTVGRGGRLANKELCSLVYDVGLDYLVSRMRYRFSTSFYLEDKYDIESLLKSEKKYDSRFWESVPRDQIFTIECRCTSTDELNNIIYGRAVFETRSLFPEILYFSADGFDLPNRRDKYNGFRQFPQVFLFRGNKEIGWCISTNNAQNTEILDKKLTHGLQFNPELRGCYMNMKDVDMSHYDNSEDCATYKGAIVFNPVTLVLLMQGVLKKYFNTIETTEIVKRESTISRKITIDKGYDIGVEEKSEKDAIEKESKSKRYEGMDRIYNLSDLAVRKVREKKEWQGGHHASPIPHDVSGHYRTYKNGKRVWIEGYHKNSINYREKKSEIGSKIIVVDK